MSHSLLAVSLHGIEGVSWVPGVSFIRALIPFVRASPRPCLLPKSHGAVGSERQSEGSFPATVSPRWGLLEALL